jgi:hypothetical protein
VISTLGLLTCCCFSVAGGGEVVFGGAVRCDEGPCEARGVKNEAQVSEQAKANGCLRGWARRPAAKALSAGAHDHLADSLKERMRAKVESPELAAPRARAKSLYIELVGSDP